MDRYEYLRPFATTKAQNNLLDAALACNTMQEVGPYLGIVNRTAELTMARIRGKAALQGVSPDNDMTHEVPSPFSVKGTSTLYDKDGAVSVQWVKTQVNENEKLQLIQSAIFDSMADYKGVYRPRKAPTTDNEDLLSCYVMGDPHIGAYAYAAQSGESFDLRIAREDLLAATSKLVRVAPKSNRALIANLGDFFHADNQKNTTTRGTFVDVAGVWQEVLQAGCTLMVDLINLALTKHPQVTVVNCIGNHDDHSSVMLSAFLGAYYRDEPRVEILPTANKFNYVQHGRVAIGFTHGDTVKLNTLSEIMATDKPELWAGTDHRYWFTGHIHHTTKQELRGSVVESFRTLASRDAWHTNSGYRSGRDMFCIVHDKQFGEVERYRCDIRRARNAQAN